ncbi:MAG: universal stress protein [Flavobacteriales bacterium]|nr:universal stress protein [Flavobacteriales bacterium]
MRSILVPTDFSECAQHAAEVGASLARESGSKLYLMHIINLPTYESADRKERHHNTAEGIFISKLVSRKFADLLQKPFLEGVEVEDIVKFNTVYESISDVSKEKNVDLIVMGSHGASGSKEFFIGSNAERIIRTSEIPVLTIKKKHDQFSIKDMVFASNFFEESYDVFGQILALAKVFRSRIHLLKVITPNHFETTQYSTRLMDDFIRATKLEVDHTINIFNDETIENGIHHFSDEIDADLIAMETHGRSGIRHMLWGSITEGVANHSDLPVLSVRIPKDPENTRVIFPD